MSRLIFLFVLFTSVLSYSQVILEADGPGNTYELINSKFAPNGDAVENPECVHPEFGRHISEVWDAVLNKYVFEFYVHVTPDNDRCINTDRQRVEIKTYETSPDYLKGTLGETITYKWKFKIPSGFKPSSSFTHIHQIKPVGGDDGNPIFTLTPRKGSPNKIELIHDNTTKVATADLSLFENVWVECTEVIKVGVSGTYSMLIKKISDGTVLLTYSSKNIMTIRPDNNFILPKWGIYRSLNNSSDLRDESIRFDDFSIQEGITEVSPKDKTLPVKNDLGQNYPNPFNPGTTISYTLGENSFVTLKIYDMMGREVASLVKENKPAGVYSAKFDGKGLSGGIYFYQLTAGTNCLTKKLSLLK